MTVSLAGFMSLHGVTTRDLPDGALDGTQAEAPDGAIAPGSTIPFTATAYCKGSVTASGAPPKNGVAAADPGLLPIGTIVQVGSGEGRANGVYTVLDTGPKVQGRLIDLYMWSCYDALSFGRQIGRAHV